MTSFASLTAGLLARKGEARPSHEPRLDLPSRQPLSAMPAPVAAMPRPQPAPPSMVRLQDVASAWPTQKPQMAQAGPSAPLPHHHNDHKTTIRLTHAQARAVRLASLVLDRPQQDILTAGLLRKLEALACADLSNCACFKAAVEGLKKPEV